MTAYYFGGAYELTDGVAKKYYSFGGQTMMRDADGLQYFLTDHLGSTVAVTNASGTLTSQQRYLPFGQVRADVPTPNSQFPITDLGYTGQRALDPGMGGLMDYHARFYSPVLGRFTQPDTITPGGPQGLNRYSYVLGNPIRYNDPTGHVISCDAEEDCKEARRVQKLGATDYLKESIHKKFGISMSDKGGKNWDTKNLLLMYSSLQNINTALNGRLKSIVGGGTWTLREHNSVDGSQYYGETSGTNVVFETLGTQAVRQMNIYHEFGHVFDNSPGLVDVFSTALRNLEDPSFITADGYLDRSALINRRSVFDPNHGSAEAIQHPYSTFDDPTIASQEQWGDIFANYVAGNINLDTTQGAAMNTFITGAFAGIP